MNNKANVSPCFGCKDRDVRIDYNCHSNCERYLDFSGERRRVGAIAVSKRHVDSVLDEIAGRPRRRRK